MGLANAETDQRRRRGPVPGPLGVLLSRAYGWVVARRNRSFDANHSIVEFDRPVISVGNLTVGGTGKSPMVMRLLDMLRRAGHNPCVAMRGYRSQGAAGSDEAAAYMRAFPALPVVAQPNRTEGLIGLFATPEGEAVDSIVLDDGFQHRQIARDFDLVLVDATADPFDDRLLPAGWLREPAESLRRASGVVITHANEVDAPTLRSLNDRITRLTGQAPIAECCHAWQGLNILDAGRERHEPASFLRSRRVFVVCAIGKPGAFLSQVRDAVGDWPVGRLVLRDHDPYSERRVRKIIAQAAGAGAELIVTTDKDWSKLRSVDPARWPCPVARPMLELEFIRGSADLEKLVLQAASINKQDPPDHDPSRQT